MKTKKLISSVLILILGVGITSCCKKPIPPEPDYAALGYKKATVINLQLDGCLWMIELEDKSKKEPNNLQEEFRVEGKTVWVKFTPVKGAMSICMAGDVVHLDDIKNRK